MAMASRRGAERPSASEIFLRRSGVADAAAEGFLKASRMADSAVASEAARSVAEIDCPRMALLRMSSALSSSDVVIFFKVK